MNKAFWFGFRRGLGFPIGWALGWSCFWMGHAWSKSVIPLIPDSWERVGEISVEPYQILMGWSVRLNDAFGLDIWQPVQQRENPND